MGSCVSLAYCGKSSRVPSSARYPIGTPKDPWEIESHGRNTQALWEMQSHVSVPRAMWELNSHVSMHMRTPGTAVPRQGA